jgi:ADP-ribose pyrophosphatase YjhB (NUDIX family)
MLSLSFERKEQLAKLVRLPLLRIPMGLAIRLIVPKHRMGIALVCLDSSGRVLLLRHVFHPTIPWGLPGGWLDRGESPADCALRELREETGLSADLGLVVHVSREHKPNHLVIAYGATIRSGSMTLSGEIIEAKWFWPDILPQPLFPFVEEAISAAVVKNKQPIGGEV